MVREPRRRIVGAADEHARRPTGDPYTTNVVRVITREEDVAAV
jgi:hypothetical protein